MPFAAVYVLRPGFTEPLHGVTSKTRAYRIFYTTTKPLLPWLRLAFPNQILTRERDCPGHSDGGQGCAKRVLESSDIRALVHG
jgi:hypothetical protein